LMSIHPLHCLKQILKNAVLLCKYNVYMTNNNQDNHEDYDMKIYPVKPTLPNMPIKRVLHPSLPRPPTSWLFIMGSGHGKSSLITNLIFRKEFYADIFDRILYISPTVEKDNSSQPFLHKTMEDIVTIRSDPQNMDAILHEFITNIDTNYSTTDDDKPDPPVSLVIADDISGFLKKTSSVTHLISRNRHYWTTMFISNQTLKDVPRVIRTLVKCVVFSHCTNDSEIIAILDEYSGNFNGGRDAMFRIWNEATKTKYNYLMINMSVENDVRIYQIGSEGLFEFEGASSSRHDGRTIHPPKLNETNVRTKPFNIKDLPDPIHCSACKQDFKNQSSYIRHTSSLKHKNNL